MLWKDFFDGELPAPIPVGASLLAIQSSNQAMVWPVSTVDRQQAGSYTYAYPASQALRCTLTQ
ncbi:hypothetical protein D3C81_1797720 [compost metagenome]